MARTLQPHRSNVAYERLRSDVLAGRWLPDDTLSTYGLAEDLGMSRTPVIEALKRLEAEGLIEIIPQVGCRVLRRAHKDITEAFMIRTALESLAAEVAADRITPEELEGLGEILLTAERAIEAQDPVRYEEANREFHLGIVQASGLDHLKRLLMELWTLHRYEMAARRFLGTRMKRSSREHRQILKALKTGDPTAAREAVDRHLRRSGEDYAEFLEAHSADGDAPASPALRSATG